MPDDPFARIREERRKKTGPPPVRDLAGTGGGDNPFAKIRAKRTGEAPPAVESKSGGFMEKATEPFLKMVTGKGLQETIWDPKEESIKSALPYDIRHDPGGYTGRLFTELAKQGTGVVDFAASPAGITLIGAHYVPYLNVAAFLVDMGLSTKGAVEAGKYALASFKDPSPENLARTVAGTMMAIGGFKGGVASMRSNFAHMGTAEPPPIRDLVRKSVSREMEGKKAEVIGTKAGELESYAEKGATKAGIRPGPDPHAKAEATRKAIHDFPVVGDIARLLGVPANRLKAMSMDMMGERSKTLQEMRREYNRVVSEIRRDVPPEWRKIENMGYVIEGDLPITAMPEAYRPSVQKLIDYNIRHAEYLKQGYAGDKQLYLRDAPTYLSHIWKFEDANQAERAGRALIKDPFLKQRKIDSYKEGIALGFKPRFTDVTDIVQARGDFAARALSNFKMATALRKLGVLASEGEAGKANLRHWKIAKDSTALYRAVYAGKIRGGDAYTYKPVRVHPDFATAVDTAFSPAMSSKGFWGGWENLTTLSKSLVLHYSLFHHWSLSEQAHALYTPRHPLLAAKSTFLFNPEFYRGLHASLWDVLPEGGRKIIGKPALPPFIRLSAERAKPYIDAGLNLDSEERASQVVGYLKKLGTSEGPSWAKLLGKPLDKVTNAMANITAGMDKSLWDYYMPGLMIKAFDTIKSDEINKLSDAGRTPEAVAEIERATSELVNNAFGAINFDNLLVYPMMRRTLKVGILAPAWTISNFRPLVKGFENETSMRLTGKYLRGAALSFFITTQLFNYAMAKHYTGKGRWTWQNPGNPIDVPSGLGYNISENALNIFAGYNPDGTERYLVPDRAAREPFRFLVEPAATFWGKIALPAKAAMVQATKHEPGSGYEVIESHAKPLDQTLERIYALTGLFLPFGAAQEAMQMGAHKLAPRTFPEPRSSSQFFGFPTRRGITEQQAADAYRIADESHNEQAKQMIREAIRDNHLSMASVMRRVRSRLTTERHREIPPARRFDVYGSPVR